MKEYVMDKIWALVFKKKFKEGLQWVNIPVIVSYQTKEYEAPMNIKDCWNQEVESLHRWIDID